MWRELLQRAMLSFFRRYVQAQPTHAARQALVAELLATALRQPLHCGRPTLPLLLPPLPPPHSPLTTPSCRGEG